MLFSLFSGDHSVDFKKHKLYDQLMQHFSRRKLFLTSIAGLLLASGLLVGCSKTTTQGTSVPTSETAQQDAMKPAVSPTVAAQDTNQAVTNEGAQLNTLNKDSTSIDQSFNDQAVAQ